MSARERVWLTVFAGLYGCIVAVMAWHERMNLERSGEPVRCRRCDAQRGRRT